MTSIIVGRFHPTGLNVGVCRHHHEVCGITTFITTATSRVEAFEFPDYFQGPFPPGTIETASGKNQCPTDRIVPLDDGCFDEKSCDENSRELTAIILFKKV